jgi:hypothetical protein
MITQRKGKVMVITEEKEIASSTVYGVTQQGFNEKQLDRETVLNSLRIYVERFVAAGDIDGLWLWLRPALNGFAMTVNGQVRRAEMAKAARENRGAHLQVTNAATGVVEEFLVPQILDVRRISVRVNGCHMLFGDMTVNDHGDKIIELQLHIDGAVESRDQHKAAKEILETAGVNTLNEITDEAVVASITE